VKIESIKDTLDKNRKYYSTKVLNKEFTSYAPTNLLELM
jgi:hypothetical protein